jgi:hypothetical protein
MITNVDKTNMRSQLFSLPDAQIKALYDVMLAADTVALSMYGFHFQDKLSALFGVIEGVADERGLIGSQAEAAAPVIPAPAPVDTIEVGPVAHIEISRKDSNLAEAALYVRGEMRATVSPTSAGDFMFRAWGYDKTGTARELEMYRTYHKLEGVAVSKLRKYAGMWQETR